MQAENAVKVKKTDQLSPTQVRLTIEVSGDLVSQKTQAALQKLMSTARIPGFRPGKAPKEVIQKKYAEEIRKDVLSHLLETGISDAIKDTKFMPVSRPNVQLKEADLKPGANFEFEAEFEIQPEVKLKKYKSFDLEAPKVEVEDKEVNEQVDVLRERMGVLEPVQAETLTKGQYAIVKVAMDVAGRKKEEAKEFTVEVGVEKLLPELDEALLQMKTGEHRDVEVKFPDTYNDAELAGRNGTFHVELLDIKTLVLPELNDAFANQLKEGMTLLELKAEIRRDLAARKEGERKNLLRQQVLEKLVEQNPLEVPASMVSERMHHLKHMMEEEMKRRGQKNVPLKLNDEEVEQLRQRAEFQVKSSLLLGAVASDEKIEVDQKRIDQRVEEIATVTKGSKEDTLKILQSRGMLDQMRDEALTDQVFDFLVQNASLKEIVAKPE